MSRIPALAQAARRFVLAVAGKLSWLPPTLARLAVGLVFLQTGWGKLHNLPQIVEYFRSLGIPAPELQAPLAAGAEFVCGGLILIGLFTRIASVPLIVTMIVAIATAKAKDIGGLSDLLGFEEFLYIVLFGWLAAAGAGPLSIDRLLVKISSADRAPAGLAPAGITEAA